jgi:hypothetical protein
MTAQEFFKPDKWKIGIAILIWLFFINTVIFQPYLSASSSEINYLIIIPLGFVAEIILSIGGVILYPFSCSIISIYRAIKTGNPIENKILTATGIVLFLIIAALWVELMLVFSAPPLPIENFSP